MTQKRGMPNKKILRRNKINEIKDQNHAKL